MSNFREWLREKEARELNESNEIQDSEYKSELILKLNKSAKLGDNLIYNEEGEKNDKTFIVYKDSTGITTLHTDYNALTSFSKGKKVDIYFDQKMLKKLI